jgi:hypothetical protein
MHGRARWPHRDTTPRVASAPQPTRQRLAGVSSRVSLPGYTLCDHVVRVPDTWPPCVHDRTRQPSTAGARVAGASEKVSAAKQMTITAELLIRRTAGGSSSPIAHRSMSLLVIRSHVSALDGTLNSRTDLYLSQPPGRRGLNSVLNWVRGSPDSSRTMPSLTAASATAQNL